MAELEVTGELGEGFVHSGRTQVALRHNIIACLEKQKAKTGKNYRIILSPHMVDLGEELKRLGFAVEIRQDCKPQSAFYLKEIIRGS